MTIPTTPAAHTTPPTPEARPARSRRGARQEFIGRYFGVLSISVVFLVLFIFFSVQTDVFLTTENLVNVARQIAPTVVVAMGMTLVITTGAIDLSVGSIVGLTAVSLASFASSSNPLLSNPIMALLLTLLVGGAVGAANGWLTAYGGVQSFIVTLAALTAVRGIALLWSEGYSAAIDSSFLLPIGNGKFLGLYTPTWIAIITVALSWYIFTRTRYGRYVTATGSNAESLRRSGVNIKRIQMSVLVIAGLLAAVAGILTATRLASGSPNSGTMFELEVITAVVLGGTSLMGGRGSIMGAAIGALTLGIISNGLVLLKINVYWVPITQGIILIVAILLNGKLFARLIRSSRR